MEGRLSSTLSATVPRACKNLLRPRSEGGGYWSAEAWDPDCRVYAGADIFHTHHYAVEPEGRKPVHTDTPQPSLRTALLHANAACEKVSCRHPEEAVK